MPLNDHDPVETQEWMDALRSVVQYQGAERMQFLLTKLRDERGARVSCRLGNDAVREHDTARVRRGASRTASSSTRSVRRSAGTPWRSSSARTRSSSELGGHIASFQSSALPKSASTISGTRRRRTTAAT